MSLGIDSAWEQVIYCHELKKLSFQFRRVPGTLENPRGLFIEEVKSKIWLVEEHWNA